MASRAPALLALAVLLATALWATTRDRLPVGFAAPAGARSGVEARPTGRPEPSPAHLRDAAPTTPATTRCELAGDEAAAAAPPVAVKLAVRDPHGQPLRAYRIRLETAVTDGPDEARRVPSFADRDVTARDHPAALGGSWAALRGLPDGRFRLRIRERNHAEMLSAEFTVARGAPPAEIEVRLVHGATVTGAVVDGQGRPVSGATVRALAPSPAGAATAQRQTAAEPFSPTLARTDARGRFRLPRLQFADYMLLIIHPDYCRATAASGRLDRESPVDVGRVQLVRGAQVVGRATAAGRPAGQVEVRVLPRPAAVPPRSGLPGPTAITGADGRYRMPERLPPGSFTARATRSAGAPGSLPTAEKTLTIPRDQPQVVLNFDFSAR